MNVAAMFLATIGPFGAQDYRLAAPMIVLALFGLLILCVDLLLPAAMKHYNAVTALAGLTATAFTTWRVQQLLPADGNALVGFLRAFRMDPFAVYFYYLYLAGAAVAVLISVKYLEIEREDHGEFYALILFCVTGMMGMVSGNDVVLIYISLETMAIGSYVLVGFLRSNRRSNEAALKYMLLGAFSSAIFVYGLSVLYGMSGSTNLTDISNALASRLASSPNDPLAILALLTVMTGMLFKIAAAPFHMWAPDAYEGAPTSITGFMSVAVKAAGWAMMLRILLIGLGPLRTLYLPMLVFVALATLAAGNFAALTQTNTKRLLAYSSISHVGYMLLGVIASDGISNRTGIKGILFYLLAYTFMNLGAFAVLTSLRRRSIIGDDLDDLGGLMRKAPTEAVLMLIFLLSLAGIPPLAGFYGKYFIFLSLMETGHYRLATIAVLFAVMAAYYYLRIANSMFMAKENTTEPVKLTPMMNAGLAITGVATVFIGVFPNPFIQAVNWSVAHLGGGGMAMLK